MNVRWVGLFLNVIKCFLHFFAVSIPLVTLTKETYRRLQIDNPSQNNSFLRSDSFDEHFGIMNFPNSEGSRSPSNYNTFSSA